MDATSNLGLPFIMAAQAQKHVTHNEALRALDAIVQLMVLDKDLAAPPGSPAEGARYIVGSAPTGAWLGQAGKIAAYQDGAWAFYTPREGWLAWVADEGKLYAWTGSAWTALPAGSLDSIVEDSAPQLGGNLDANGHSVGFDSGTGLADDAGNEQLVLHKTATAVNQLAITNAAAGTGPLLGAEGDDTNVDLRLAAKGTGVVRSASQVAVSSPVYPPLRLERTTAATNAPFGVLQVLATSTGDIIDGFATNTDFAIQDNSAVITNIGSLQFVRSGADNSGRFRVLPANAGTQSPHFEISPAGNPFFPGVGTTAAGANAVLNNGASPANELLRSTSSARYKDNIEDVAQECADNILRLRPVWYRSKCAADNPAWSWYGLVAEEVAKVEPRLVCWGYNYESYEVRSKNIDGQVILERELRSDAQLIPDGVAYDRLTVLLLSLVQRHDARIKSIEISLAELAIDDQLKKLKT
jgi:hypothetical protein